MFCVAEASLSLLTTKKKECLHLKFQNKTKIPITTTEIRVCAFFFLCILCEKRRSDDVMTANGLTNERAYGKCAPNSGSCAIMSTWIYENVGKTKTSIYFNLLCVFCMCMLLFRFISSIEFLMGNNQRWFVTFYLWSTFTWWCTAMNALWLCIYNTDRLFVRSFKLQTERISYRN